MIVLPPRNNFETKLITSLPLYLHREVLTWVIIILAQISTRQPNIGILLVIHYITDYGSYNITWYYSRKIFFVYCKTGVGKLRPVRRIWPTTMLHQAHECLRELR